MDINMLNTNAVTTNKNIYILALGGTIASSGINSTDEFYSRPSNDISELISQVAFKNTTIHSEQFLQKISHEITMDDLLIIAKKIQEIVNRDDIDAVVITQGTNCLEETAYFVNLVVNTKKIIVFTGAFRASNALGFDGGRNLYNAILIASKNYNKSMGVVVTFNDAIVCAREATKMNPSCIGDFSVNGKGVIGFIQGDVVHVQQSTLFKHTCSSEFTISNIEKLPEIYIIFSYLGADDLFVNAAITSGAAGIISAGVGKGYQPEVVTKALNNANNQGMIIVRCTRYGQGIVNKESKTDGSDSFISGGSLSPQKAKILLMVQQFPPPHRLHSSRAL